MRIHRLTAKFNVHIDMDPKKREIEGEKDHNCYRASMMSVISPINRSAAYSEICFPRCASM
jgi:hypothetical protein